MNQLKDIGAPAIPVLLRGIREEQIRDQCIQVLSDVRALEAVPLLVEELRGVDDKYDWFVIGALGRITGHPRASTFLRLYFEASVRADAAESYRKWWRDHTAKRAASGGM